MRIRPTGIGRGRVVALATLLSLSMGATAAAAVTAQPKKGATYSGKIKRDKLPIRFTVSKTGGSVSHFKIKYAPFIYCQGGGATVKSRSARVSSRGTFKARLPIKDLNGKPGGHMTVTGKFAKGGQETGRVRVALNSVPPGSTCNGSSSYSTTAG